MNLSIGIVGLPNVGKSTLFNSLTQNDIPAENYPFCTIDPNVGIVPVEDPRLARLTEIVKPAKTTPAVVEFWDIAGLVKGAASGEGLGNKFLANIRNVSAIVHVVRAFANDNITHVEDSVAPERDIELINAELILKDLETVEQKINGLQGKARADVKMKPLLASMEDLKKHLESGKLAKSFSFDRTNEDLAELIYSLFLLTNKPTIYLVNSEDDKITQNVELIKSIVDEGDSVVGMDIKQAFEVMTLSAEERLEYMEALGLAETPIAQLTRSAYALLGLMSFSLQESRKCGPGQ